MNKLIDKICKVLEIGIYSNKWKPCKIPGWINTDKMLPSREGGTWIVKGKTFVYKVVEQPVGGTLTRRVATDRSDTVKKDMNLPDKIGYGLLVLACILFVVSVVILRSDTIIGWIIPVAIVLAILSVFAFILGGYYGSKTRT